MKNPNVEPHEEFSALLAQRNPLYRQQRINATVADLMALIAAMTEDNRVLQEQNTKLRKQNAVLLNGVASLAEAVETLQTVVLMTTGGAD